MPTCLNTRMPTSLYAYITTCMTTGLHAYMPICLYAYMPICLHAYIPTLLQHTVYVLIVPPACFLSTPGQPTPVLSMAKPTRVTVSNGECPTAPHGNGRSLGSLHIVDPYS
jgi:hypothetical protein